MRSAPSAARLSRPATTGRDPKETSTAHRWLLLLTVIVASGPFIFGPRPDLLFPFAARGSPRPAAPEPVPETRAIPKPSPPPEAAIAGPAPEVDPPAGGSEEEPPLQTEGSAAADLLATITTGSFAKREDVSTGRFLHRFDAVRLEIGELDTSKIQLRRLGEGWALIDVPRLPGRAPEGTGSGARLRLVYEEKAWKVESLRALP